MEKLNGDHHHNQGPFVARLTWCLWVLTCVKAIPAQPQNGRHALFGLSWADDPKFTVHVPSDYVCEYVFGAREESRQ